MNKQQIMKSSSSLNFWLWIKYQWRQLGRKSSDTKHPWPCHQWDICVFQKCLFPDNNKITTRLFIFDWTKPTYIQPSNLSIKLHPSSVLWGIQTIKRSRPATTNWEDQSVTPPYDFPGFHATPSVCRPGSLPSLQNFRSLLSWSPLNCWLRSKSGAFFGGWGVVDLPEFDSYKISKKVVSKSILTEQYWRYICLAHKSLRIWGTSRDSSLMLIKHYRMAKDMVRLL